MAKIMFIRHGEKPTETAQGVTPAGVDDKEDLIVLGWQRAGALVRFFAPYPPAKITADLDTPAFLFAAAATAAEGSMRPQHTIMPLAAELGLTTNASFGKADLAALASAVVSASAKGAVLVAWQHTDIPKIVDAIAGKGSAPHKWHGDRFDLVWVLDSNGSGGWTFSQVPQMLLAGDSPKPMK